MIFQSQLKLFGIKGSRDIDFQTCNSGKIFLFVLHKSCKLHYSIAAQTLLGNSQWYVKFPLVMFCNDCPAYMHFNA